jgi:hypothetical protein
VGAGQCCGAGPFLCGSGSRLSTISALTLAPAPAIFLYILEKFFHGFNKISYFLKPKMIIKNFLQENSFKKIVKTQLQILVLRLKAFFSLKIEGFCNILNEFIYPESEQGQKTWASALARSCRSTNSGSANSGSATLVPVVIFLIGLLCLHASFHWYGVASCYLLPTSNGTVLVFDNYRYHLKQNSTVYR